MYSSIRAERRRIEAEVADQELEVAAARQALGATSMMLDSAIGILSFGLLARGEKSREEEDVANTLGATVVGLGVLILSAKASKDGAPEAPNPAKSRVARAEATRATGCNVDDGPASTPPGAAKGGVETTVGGVPSKGRRPRELLRRDP